MNSGSNKVRVVHVVQDLDVGGIERVIATMVGLIDRSLFDVEVWALAAGGALADAMRANGQTVREIGVRSYHNPAALWRLWSMIRRLRPDILHMHAYFAATAARLASLPCSRIGRIQQYHTIYHRRMTRANIILDRLLNLVTHRIVMVSRSSLQSFESAGYRFSKPLVIYNGIAVPDTAPGETETHKAFKSTRIGIVASLTPHKGHTWLLRAFKLVREQITDAELWIIGDGPLRANLERECVELGLPASAVTFHGVHKNPPALIARCGCAVLSSTREGTPLSIIEAMAVGRPVVATSVGGIPEIVVDGECGLLVPPSDPQAMATALVAILGDPAVQSAYGDAALKRFRSHFDGAIMNNALQNLYANLLKEINYPRYKATLGRNTKEQ